MSDMQDVVIKVLTDSSFRETLLAKPEQTLLSIGITPDSDILDALRHTDPEALRILAETFAVDGSADCGLCACAC